MWQLLTRESPYHEYHENPQVVIYQIISKNLRPRFPLPTYKSSPLIATKSSHQFSAMAFNKSSVNSCESLENHLNPDVLAYSRSVSNLSAKLSPDNSEFERVYRNLIELSWCDDPARRYDAKTLKEVLLNTNISYSWGCLYFFVR